MEKDIKELIVDQLKHTDTITESSIHYLEDDGDHRYKVHVVDGADKGKVHYLYSKRTTVGRGPTGIRLQDIDVSRLHASFEVQDHGQVLIRDLGSTNGTYVNDVRVAEITLKSSDKIKIGTTVLQFTVEKISGNQSERE